MASRRTFRILLAIGVIALLVGALALASAPAPSVVSETDFLPPGWTNYLEYPKAMVAGGTIAGTWQSANGTPVQVFVYNDADYGAYANGQNLTGLYNVTAVNGSLSLSISGFDTYHVVVQHAVGYENTNVTVTVQVTLTGWDPTLTIGGIAGLVIGALLITLSARRLRSPHAPAGTMPSRATVQGPPPQDSWEATLGGSGTLQVPPPLPGSPGGGGAPTPSASSSAASPSAATDASAPVGNVLVTVANGGAADASLDLVVNGVPVTHVTVPAGQSQVVNVSARLASPFGSMVTVEAVQADGRRAKQAVFVGAKGTAPLTLRVG